MTLRQARKFLIEHKDEIFDAFQRDHTAPTGGLINPRVVSVSRQGHLEFRCHYDNYDNAEDSWTWFLIPGTMTFYN